MNYLGLGLSLRSRLIMLVGLATIPALALTLYTGLEQRHEAREGAKASALALARGVAVTQRQKLAEAHNTLWVLSQTPVIQQLDAEASWQVFSRLRMESNQYSALVLTDPAGTVLASSPKTEREVSSPRSPGSNRLFSPTTSWRGTTSSARSAAGPP